MISLLLSLYFIVEGKPNLALLYQIVAYVEAAATIILLGGFV